MTPSYTISEKVAFIESVFGRASFGRSCKNIEVWCPICNSPNKLKRKLSIKTEGDLNHCWVCGWSARSLVPLLIRFSTKEKLAEYKSRFLKRTDKSYDENVDDLFEQRVELPSDFKMLPELQDSRDPDIRAVIKYITERGLTERDMWLYKIGASDTRMWRRRAIIPSFNVEGKLNYFVGRTIDPTVFPKYENPAVDRRPVIFNELNINWNKRLVLCEGVFDMFKCGDNAVPLLGSDINESSALFDAIVSNNTPVALALDGDMWTTKTPKVAKKLESYNVDVVVVDTREFVDPGNATKQQFAEALAAAKRLTWSDVFMTKLARASRANLSI